MPKRPPRPSPAPSPSPSPSPSSTASDVTSESSHDEILRAKILVRTEIMRRRAFADLQALQAELAEMPPLLVRDAPPANED